MNKNPFVSYSEFYKKLDNDDLENPSMGIPDTKFKDLTNVNIDSSNSNSSNAGGNDTSISSSDIIFTRPNTNGDSESNKKNNNRNKQSKLEKEITTYIKSLDLEDEYKNYLIKLAKRESNFNPEVINAQGYKGLFQFGDDALKDIGMTTSDYMSDWKKQVDAVIKFTNKNRERLRTTLRGVGGKDIDGTKINEWGLLGAAHLGGVGGVNKFLFNGMNPTDANNTSVKDYLLYFSK